MRREGLQSQVGHAQLEPPGQLDGAHDGVHRKLAVRKLSLRGKKPVVEGDVVRYQRPPAQQVEHVPGDVGELRLVFQHGRGQSVDVGGPRVNARVEQAADGLLHPPVGVQRQHRQADDPVGSGPEARRLHVDDGPAPAGPVCRADPRCGSRDENRTPARHRRAAAGRVVK